MAYQKPDLGGSLLRGLQGAKALEELEKLKREAKTEQELRDAFTTPIASTTPQTTEIEGKGVNLGTTARPPTKEEGIARAYQIDPDKASKIEENLMKARNYIESSRQHKIASDMQEKRNKIGIMSHALEVFKAGDKEQAIKLLQENDPNDDTTDIIQVGQDDFRVTSKKNPKGITVNLKQLITAGATIEEQFKQMEADKRFNMELNRKEAKDKEGSAARLKQAKTVTQGERQAIFADLSDKFKSFAPWAGMSDGKQRSLSEDVARRTKELYAEALNRGEELPIQQAKDQALGEITPRIREARKGKIGSNSNARYYSSAAEVIKDGLKKDPSLLSVDEMKNILKYGFKPEDVDNAVKNGLISAQVAENIKKKVWAE